MDQMAGATDNWNEPVTYIAWIYFGNMDRSLPCIFECKIYFADIL